MNRRRNADIFLLVITGMYMFFFVIAAARIDEITHQAAITEKALHQAAAIQAQRMNELEKKIDVMQNTPPPCVVPNEIMKTKNSVDTTAISETSQIMPLPNETGGAFKGFMDYRTLTDTTAKQWALQQDAVTDAAGFRKHNGRFMIALGTYYATEAGELFDIEFENGVLIHCITGDIKNDLHTDRTNRYNEGNGCIVEFIVDTDKISEKSAIHGDMSHSGLYGEIISIIKITDTEEVNDIYYD